MSFQNPLPPGIRQVVPDYVSDGVTTTFGFPFRLWAAPDLFVGVAAAGASSTATWEQFTQLALNSAYTVNISGLSGATVTLAAPQPQGTLIRLAGLRTPSRLTSVVNDGVLQSVPFESELDCVEATLQEVRRDASAETTRALAAETTLATAISTETMRALAAEATLAADISTGITAAEATLAGTIASETTRAINAEATLAAATSAETTRAERAEGALTNEIAALTAPTIATALGITNLALLPTTLPSTAGTFWVNGGALCVTPGGANPLPAACPTTPGLYWSNGGAVCIS